MTIDPERPLWSAREVAAALNVHVNTVKHLSDKDDLPFVRINRRGDRRYDPVDVEKFLARKTWRR